MKHKSLIPFSYILFDIFIFSGLFHFGITQIFLNDSSRITLIIIMIYFLTNFLLLISVFIPKEEYLTRFIQWIPHNLVNLGLLGTVIGFYYVFADLFSQLDLEDSDKVKEILAQLTDGFSISIISTITGISAFLLTTLKLVWFRLKDE